MRCNNCGFEVQAGAKFCPECGSSLAATCKVCGTPQSATAKFCSECGARLGPGPGTAAQPEISGQPAPTSSSTNASISYPADIFRRFIPQEFAERLLATRGKLSAERRIVTILFCDIKGSTELAHGLDPEDVADIMNGAFDYLIPPIYHYEGTLARLMGDAILAFFGAPISHGNDAERGIRAGLEIITGIRQYAARLRAERGLADFDVRVGLNTGLVVVGEVGSDLRVEYTAMGDAINLAARMEQNAPPGGVLITEETFRQARALFEMQPQPPLQVKGSPDLLRTYLVLQPKARTVRLAERDVEGVATPMVGRDAEMLALQNAFRDAVEERETRVVMIVGEAGVGKSRLVDEFAEWIDLQPEQVVCLRGRAVVGSQASHYGMIRDMFCQCFHILESDSASIALAKFRSGMEGLLRAEQAELVGQLVGFEFRSVSRAVAHSLDSPDFVDRARGDLVQYFRALAAHSPVALFLEDLHWADDASTDFVACLAEEVPGALMVIVAARPELYERRPAWAAGPAGFVRLDLARLSRRQTRLLVEKILCRTVELPASLCDLIVEGADGNPFYVEELIKVLIDDGVIVPSPRASEGDWQVVPERLAAVRIPPTLTGVLQARLDALPALEKAVLQRAAVVGRQFWDELVAALATEDLGGEPVGRLLADVQSRELIFRRERSAFSDAGEYVFKHSLLRDVSYASLLLKVRRKYHGEVARWLEAHAGERMGEYLAAIAAHYEAAGDIQNAVRCLLGAGDRARSMYFHQDAINQYQHALVLQRGQSDDGGAARTLMKLGLAYQIAFDFESATTAYEEGFALWRTTGLAQPASNAVLQPLRMSWPEPAMLDPGQNYETTALAILDQLFSGLVMSGPGLDVLPDIAASWEIMAGARRYVFHLRSDARWSDGTPVTARDFELAWRRVLDPQLGSNSAEVLFDIVGARDFHACRCDWCAVGVRVPDPLTLVVDLEGPSSYFLQLLTVQALYPVPRHVVEQRGERWADPDEWVGNGPFKLTPGAWRRGIGLDLERNPSYHGMRQGNIATVEICFDPDPRRSFDDGERDALDLSFLPTPVLERMRHRHPTGYLTGPVLSTVFLLFNFRSEPLADPRVRRAMMLALDRSTLAGRILGGRFAPATGGFMPPAMPGHVPALALGFDPETARDLMAEAGYPAGRGFPIIEAVQPEKDVIPGQLEYMTTQWQAELGIAVRWRTLPFENIMAQWARGEIPSLFMTRYSAGYPDPDDYLRGSCCLRQDLGPDPALATLLGEAQRATSQDVRMELYRQAEVKLAGEVIMVPLLYSRMHLLLQPWVRNYPVSPLKWWSWKDVVIDPH